jgi:hypothetical protein
VVLLHLRGVFHGDEDNSEVMLFEEGFGEVAGLPGLLLLGVGDFLVKVKLRQPVDHGAVFLGGRHFGFLSASNVYALSLVKCKDRIGRVARRGHILVFRLGSGSAGG